jgi:hypothetical protein
MVFQIDRWRGKPITIEVCSEFGWKFGSKWATHDDAIVFDACCLLAGNELDAADTLKCAVQTLKYATLMKVHDSLIILTRWVRENFEWDSGR